MTFIEWVLNPDNKTRGITVNSKTGCLNHTPEGLCLGGMFPCYAFKLANGRLRERYLANTNLAPNAKGGISRLTIGRKTAVEREGDYADPFYPRYWPERLEQIRKIKKPTGIFLDDMSDWMGDYWLEEWTEQEIQVMRDCPHHRFYTLTKQPQNLIKWSPFPDNCWVGFTATNDRALQYGLAHIADVEAKVKYISFEPLLERVNFLAAEMVDWVIIGAQTKPYRPPKIEWVEEIVRAADKAGVKVFLKDSLRPILPDRMPFYRKPYSWWLRQELPE